MADAKHNKIYFERALASQEEFKVDVLLDQQKGPENALAHSLNDEMEILTSPWSRSLAKITWSSKRHAPLDSNGGSTFYMNTTDHHFARLPSFSATFPVIKVKSQYQGMVRICWPNYVGFAPLDEVNLKIDKMSGGKLNHLVNDVCLQFFRNPESSSSHINEMTGNIPCLTEWAEFLPKWRTDVPLMFNLGSESNPIELHLCQNAFLTAKIRSKITDLLRMQQKQDNVWINTDVETCFLDNVTTETTIEYEFSVEYGKVTPEELSELRKDAEIRRNRWYIDHIVVSSERPFTYGQITTIRVRTPEQCIALMQLVQRIDYLQFHNFSNYTTDENLSFGLDPMDWHVYSHGDDVTEFAGHNSLLSRVKPYYYHLSSPLDPGYAIYPLGYHPAGPVPDISYNLSSLNSSWSIKLLDHPPPQHEYEKMTETVKPSFSGWLILRIQKQYQIHRIDGDKYEHREITKRTLE